MESHSGLLETVAAERESVDSDTLEQMVTLGVELAREGRKVGTIFTVGNAGAVEKQSQPMILDPLAGHDDEARRLDRPDTRETLKELALLDGAFVISNDGVALSATRYLDADASELKIPGGAGQSAPGGRRHRAGHRRRRRGRERKCHRPPHGRRRAHGRDHAGVLDSQPPQFPHRGPDSHAQRRPGHRTQPGEVG